ncbi:glutaredoxin family protein [Devriesea agamarum]|uniref:glutaredoxin family protein n=1 Tax=Devriesea agamarum TaxID=472569 RepID=UPI00071DF58F|nr:glutaredoxin family protein [Devriesea agamarum]
MPDPTPCSASAGSTPPRVTFVTRVGCHLCEEALPVVRRIAEAHGADVVVRDVDADPDDRARFGEDVPVVLVAGRVICRFRVHEAALTKALGCRPWWRRVLGR